MRGFGSLWWQHAWLKEQQLSDTRTAFELLKAQPQNNLSVSCLSRRHRHTHFFILLPFGSL